jgi:hypothetical protein
MTPVAWGGGEGVRTFLAESFDSQNQNKTVLPHTFSDILEPCEVLGKSRKILITSNRNKSPPLPKIANSSGGVAAGGEGKIAGV